MNFKKRLKFYFKFNEKIFGRLDEKCRRETKFGKVLNFVLYFSYFLVRALKLVRAKVQWLVSITLSPIAQKLFPPKVIVYPVMPWDKSLPEVFATAPTKVALIIAELSIPQCTRYRVDQKVVAFKKLGYDVRVCSFTDLEACVREIPFATLVVFYRTPYWEPVQRMIKECHRLKIPTFYDIDDLVFDVEEYRKYPVVQTLPKKDSAGLLHGAQLYQDCLSACQYGISSTPVLAECFKKFMKGRVFIVENALDDLSLKAHAYSQQMPKPHDDKIVIGYGSGTKSHDADFDLAKDGLMRIMREFPNVNLAIHGYLQLSSEFDQFSTRIFRVPFLKADQYLHAVSRFTINLAPLTACIFNDAKSNIKFLEASSCGVPTVASPCAAFAQVIRDGENALLASSSEEWYVALKKLVTSSELRKKLADNAQKTAFTLYHPDVMAESLAKILEVVPEPARSPKTKLMQVNCLYAPFSFGGATIVVERLAKEMVPSHDVVIVTANQLPELPEFGCYRYEYEGAHVYSVKSSRHMLDSKSYDDPEFARAFGRILDRERPSVVHFHAVQGMGGNMLAEAKRRGIKTVVTAHDAWWICERQFMLTPQDKFCGQTGEIDLKICTQCTGHADFTYRRMQMLTAWLGDADKVLTPSTFHTDLVRVNALHPDRVDTNRNGVVLPAKVALPRTRAASGKVRFAYLGGGNSVHKGYFFIKEIFERLAHSNYQLIIPDIHQRIGHLGVNPDEWNIKGELRVVKPFDHTTIDDFFEEVDVLLFPSQWHESFGMTVREAIMRNCWVISTRSGGILDAVQDGKNGHLVNIGDQKGYAEKIKYVLENPTFLDGYVASGKEEIIDYATQAKELVGVYQSL